MKKKKAHTKTQEESSHQDTGRKLTPRHKDIKKSGMDSPQDETGKKKGRRREEKPTTRLPAGTPLKMDDAQELGPGAKPGKPLRREKERGPF